MCFGACIVILSHLMLKLTMAVSDGFEGDACTGVDCTSSITCPEGSFPRGCQTSPLNSGGGSYVSAETLACVAKGTADGSGGSIKVLLN